MGKGSGGAAHYEDQGKGPCARPSAWWLNAFASSGAGATSLRYYTHPGCLQVALGGDVAVGVHGGPLLGISYKRLTASGAELSGEDTSPVMQLWSWDGRTKVGAGMESGSPVPH
jgi:hypothetical protein